MSKKLRRSIIDGTASREEPEDPEEQAEKIENPILVAIRTRGTNNGVESCLLQASD